MAIRRFLTLILVGAALLPTACDASMLAAIPEIVQVLGTPSAAPGNVPNSQATPSPSVPTAASPAPTEPPIAAVPQDPLAEQVLALCNEHRATAGLGAFVLDAALSKVATARSTDMRDRDYFAHTDPDGRSPFWHLEQAGISYRAAGENIALGQRTAADVVKSWMNSPGHRRNILSEKYGRLGVGTAKTAAGKIYWTQLFIN